MWVLLTLGCYNSQAAFLHKLSVMHTMGLKQLSAFEKEDVEGQSTECWH